MAVPPIRHSRRIIDGFIRESPAADPAQKSGITTVYQRQKGEKQQQNRRHFAMSSDFTTKNIIIIAIKSILIRLLTSLDLMI